MSAPGVRARVRAELTREIAEVARRHLASDGAAALSLRAVARELGMASSAVYRYFPSRDDLLTALIVDAYDAMGEAAEVADAERPGSDLIGRWQAACAAVRTWALANPHEYALVYGSPVPGYAAPEATIGPAGRVGVVLCRIVADGIASGVDRRHERRFRIGHDDPARPRRRARAARRPERLRRRPCRARLDEPVRPDQLRAVRPHPQRGRRPRGVLHELDGAPGRRAGRVDGTAP